MFFSPLCLAWIALISPCVTIIYQPYCIVVNHTMMNFEGRGRNTKILHLFMYYFSCFPCKAAFLLGSCMLLKWITTLCSFSEPHNRTAASPCSNAWPRHGKRPPFIVFPPEDCLELSRARSVRYSWVRMTSSNSWHWEESGVGSRSPALLA